MLLTQSIFLITFFSFSYLYEKIEISDLSNESSAFDLLDIFRNLDWFQNDQKLLVHLSSYSSLKLNVRKYKSSEKFYLNLTYSKSNENGRDGDIIRKEYSEESGNGNISEEFHFENGKSEVFLSSLVSDLDKYLSKKIEDHGILLIVSVDETNKEGVKAELAYLGELSGEMNEEDSEKNINRKYIYVPLEKEGYQTLETEVASKKDTIIKVERDDGLEIDLSSVSTNSEESEKEKSGNMKWVSGVIFFSGVSVIALLLRLRLMEEV